MSRDPNSGTPDDPKTLHKYLYVASDPVNAWDPSGRALAKPRERGGDEYTTIILVVTLAAVISLPPVQEWLVCKLNQDAELLQGVAANIGHVQSISFGRCSATVTRDTVDPGDTVYPLPYPLTQAITAPPGGPGECRKGEAWHHILPQAERDFFEHVCNFPSIDVPNLGMCLEDKCHARIHGLSNGTSWNDRWNTQIIEWGNKCPGKTAVIRFAQQLAVEFADDLLCSQ